MADTASRPTVAGLFRDQAAAEEAVDRLAAAGFSGDEIGLLAPGEAREPDYLKAEATGVATGGVLGGVAGAILGAATVGAIPGIGPILAAGAIVPIVVLAFTGASAGSTIGALFAAAATQDQGLYYLQEVRSGRGLVTVTTDRPAEVRGVLEAAGAMEVADLGSSDTAQKVAEEEAQTGSDERP
jgi:hypothetical protein